MCVKDYARFNSPVLIHEIYCWVQIREGAVPGFGDPGNSAFQAPIFDGLLRYLQKSLTFCVFLETIKDKVMNTRIVELSQSPELAGKAVDFFWKCWGNDKNFAFYEDCIVHSLDKNVPLPKFYLALDQGDRIIGTYALLTNDLISRQDLMPWLACLFVAEEHRNQGIAGRLLEHGLKEAGDKGFEKLYLYTDLVNFYERKGWRHLCNGYNVGMLEVKIYVRETARATTPPPEK